MGKLCGEVAKWPCGEDAWESIARLVKREMVDTSAHASSAFAHTLGYHITFPTTWGKGR